MKTIKKCDVIFPTTIEYGTYVEGNKRRGKFNQNNPKHIRLFENFYGVKVI